MNNNEIVALDHCRECGWHRSVGHADWCGTSAPEQNNMGLIWKGDKMEYLSQEEYSHWMNNPLPLGWGIIRPPKGYK